MSLGPRSSAGGMSFSRRGLAGSLAFGARGGPQQRLQNQEKVLERAELEDSRSCSSLHAHYGFL